jgi:hypothetical protein
MLSFNAIGDAVQRAAEPALRSFAIALLGLAQDVRIDRHHGVQLLVVERDPRQVLLNQLARRDAPARHRLLHVHDGGFDDVEFGSRRGAQLHKKQNDQKPLHHRPPLNQDCRLQETAAFGRR